LSFSNDAEIFVWHEWFSQERSNTNETKSNIDVRNNI